MSVCVCKNLHCNLAITCICQWQKNDSKSISVCLPMYLVTVSTNTYTCKTSLDFISNTSPLVAVSAPPERKLYAASPDYAISFWAWCTETNGYWSCHYGIADFWTSDGHSKGLMIHARAQTNTSVKCGLHTIVYTGIMKYLEIPKTLVLLAWNPISSLALGKENL